MWRTDRRRGRITDRKPPLEMMAASATNSQGYNLLSHVSQNIPEHQGKGTSLNLKFSYTTLLSPSQSLSSPFSALPCFYFHFHFLCYYIFIYLLFTCQVFVTPSSTWASMKAETLSPIFLDTVQPLPSAQWLAHSKCSIKAPSVCVCVSVSEWEIGVLGQLMKVSWTQADPPGGAGS